MIDSRRVLQLALIFLLPLALGTIAGGLTGYRMGKGDAPRPESIAPATAQLQLDGSLVLERRPAPVAPAKAPHAIPPGAVEERRVAVTVQPEREDCPPVRLDLSLIREGDGRRVIASSQDGRVTGGLDIPIERSLIPPPSRPWAAGVSWEPRQELGGVWLQRDVSRLVLGAAVAEEAGGGLRTEVRVGWRF
jgi:hypothetical protein